MSSILMSLGLADPSRSMATSNGVPLAFAGPQSTKQKGQLRNAVSKPSGAAQLKRNAKKRNNINKRKGK